MAPTTMKDRLCSANIVMESITHTVCSWTGFPRANGTAVSGRLRLCRDLDFPGVLATYSDLLQIINTEKCKSDNTEITEIIKDGLDVQVAALPPSITRCVSLELASGAACFSQCTPLRIPQKL